MLALRPVDAESVARDGATSLQRLAIAGPARTQHRATSPTVPTQALATYQDKMTGLAGTDQVARL